MSEAPLTDNQAIDALGGTVKTADLFRVRPTVVSNWRKRGIPGRYHYTVATLCQERGINWTPPSPTPPPEAA